MGNEINRSRVSSEGFEFFDFGLETSGFVKYEPAIIDRFFLLDFFPLWREILTKIFLHIILFSLTLRNRMQYFFYIDISLFSRIQDLVIRERSEYLRVVNVGDVPNDGVVEEFLYELLLQVPPVVLDVESAAIGDKAGAEDMFRFFKIVHVDLLLYRLLFHIQQ